MLRESEDFDMTLGVVGSVLGQSEDFDMTLGVV